MTSGKFLKFDALLLFSAVCGVSGIVLDFIIGNDLATIFGMLSWSAWWTYYVRRLSDLAGSRFVKARRSLNLALRVTVLGAIVISVASVENYLSPGSGLLLKIFGGVFLFGGIPGIVLLIRPPKP